jgi:DNA repair protein RecN (Recombination protein N)
LISRAGLSVLTGETGAGKSILLDALSLALGARGDASLVRHGAAQGQVTAVFDVPRNHPARALLAENALDDDGDIILRRVQTADGRTRVFVNDQPASVALMRDIGRRWSRSTASTTTARWSTPAAHRDLLDAFGGHVGEVARGGGLAALARAPSRLLPASRQGGGGAREADYLRAPSKELTKLDPQPGEEDELAERRARMMRAEKIAADINDAGRLSGQASPVPQLVGLLRRLQRKAAEAPGLLDEMVRALDEALVALDAAQEASMPRCGRLNSIRRLWSGRRSGCFRCAQRRASFPCRSTSWRRCATLWRRPRRPRCGRGAAGRARAAGARQKATL